MQARPAKDARANEEDLFNEGVEEILVEYGDDARKAIRALLAQISDLEMARNRAIELTSFGYARGKLQ